MNLGEQLHELETRSLELCYEIEKIGASPEQTNAIIHADNLHKAIQFVAVEWDRQNASTANTEGEARGARQEENHE